MRVPGFCTGCRKTKNIKPDAFGLANLAAGGMAQGLCQQCQDDEDKKRRGARRFR